MPRGQEATHPALEGSKSPPTTSGGDVWLTKNIEEKQNNRWGAKEEDHRLTCIFIVICLMFGIPTCIYLYSLIYPDPEPSTATLPVCAEVVVTDYASIYSLQEIMNATSYGESYSGYFVYLVKPNDQQNEGKVFFTHDSKITLEVLAELENHIDSTKIVFYEGALIPPQYMVGIGHKTATALLPNEEWIIGQYETYPYPTCIDDSAIERHKDMIDQSLNVLGETTVILGQHGIDATIAPMGGVVSSGPEKLVTNNTNLQNLIRVKNENDFHKTVEILESNDFLRSMDMREHGLIQFVIYDSETGKYAYVEVEANGYNPWYSVIEESDSFQENIDPESTQ